MNEATLAQTVMTLLILLVFLGFLIWGIKSRQFHNIEDAKYRIFNQNNDNDGEDDKHREELQ